MTFAKKIYGLLLIISVVLTVFLSRGEIESRETRVMNVLSLHCERISNQMYRAVYATEVLKEVFKSNNGSMEQSVFDALAHAVGEGTDYVTIQAMPNGIVEFAYPYEENKSTVGHDVFKDSATAIESHKAKEENKFIISGPFQLLQGMEGLAIRNPLYLEDESDSNFWGFITIVLPVPESLQGTGVFELEELGYEYEITAQYKNEDIIFASTNGFKPELAQQKPISIGDNVWEMGLYRKNDVRELWVYSVLLLATFALVSTIIFIVLKKIERRLNHDLLTGAFNRRLLETYIKSSHFSKSLCFTLFFLDLNGFKPVNDTYGHAIGDLLLIAFVKRMQGNIKNDGTVYRVGGDEFVIVIPGLKIEKDVLDVESRISQQAEIPFAINGIKVKISTSIGSSQFPSDSTDMKELLTIADEKMYKNKKAFKLKLEQGE